jgi:hypothetical protein
MTHLHHEVDFAQVVATLVRDTRSGISATADRLATQIQDRVEAYAGPTTGRRHRLIELACSTAASHFMEAIEHPGAPTRSVDELFRRMGHGEASEANTLVAMQAAFRVVNRQAWQLFRDYAVTHNWSASVLGELCDALFAFTEHLMEQVRLGYEGTRRVLERAPEHARELLMDGLITGAPLADVQPHAITGGWPLPPTFRLVTLSPSGDEPLPPLTGLDDRYLVRSDPGFAAILAAPVDQPHLLSVLLEHSTHYHVATSWAVEREAIPDAWRWTRRALELVDRGVIPATPVVDCSEHRAQLWLHSEPGIRQRLCQELLRPLLAETPNSREILSETLLAWLESRDSAPAIAAKLGVHPQTVRYRWKRINELFGEELREPEFVTQATMLLKASVPLWKAGDQSDFERFRSEDPR